ncbi:MAG TPA: winged helix-turn-helix domain-containing protein [Candidatus Dormibacteraeota bacterium]
MSQVGGDRLLLGEDPGTTHVEDARHWVSVYTQMLEFKERLLERAREDSRSLPKPARAEIDELDLPLLEQERDRVAERLQWWRARHWELARIDIDHGGRTIAFEGRVIDLTQRELQLLELLLNNPNRYIASPDVLTRAWHDPELAPEQVRSYVTRLRRKLADAHIPCRLETRPRRGYRLVFD